MDKSFLEGFFRSVGHQTQLNAVLERLGNALYRRFGINRYCYSLLFETGEWIGLTTNEICNQRHTACYEQSDLCQLSLFSLIDHHPNMGCFLGDCADDTAPKTQGDPHLRKLLQEYDNYHHFDMRDIIYTPRGKVLQICSYFAPEQSTQINHFYINNIELLKRFNRHVHHCFEEKLTTISLIPVTAKESRAVGDYFKKLIPNHTAQKAFVKETQIHFPKFNELANLTLTPHQKDIISWYLLGKSTSDTAAILDLSPRTIATHFQRLRLKFNCHSKTQLILKLIDAGLIEPDDWKRIY